MDAPLERSISQLVLPTGKTVAFALGDITDEAVDAIVNAANSALSPGSGVAGAIAERGGPSIEQESRRIVAERGRIPEGQVAITNGGELPAKFVIHAVGPMWRSGNHGEAEKLASCFREAIALADSRQLKSIAFPAISTGVFGYPVAEAAEIAVSETVAALETATHVNDVHFVLYDPATFAEFVKRARKLAAERNLKFDTYTVP